MRKIEQRMNNKVNYRESNTEVIVKGANVFVRLYDTYIYAKVRGKVYFSDGGFNTATTSSRLRALGADYSTNNKLLVRFLGDAWYSDVVEEWVKRIEHDKNNDVDYVIDTYMFGVIENDRERKSSDFHVSFYYRG